VTGQVAGGGESISPRVLLMMAGYPRAASVLCGACCSCRAQAKRIEQRGAEVAELRRQLGAAQPELVAAAVVGLAVHPPTPLFRGRERHFRALVLVSQPSTFRGRGDLDLPERHRVDRTGVAGKRVTHRGAGSHIPHPHRPVVAAGDDHGARSPITGGECFLPRRCRLRHRIITGPGLLPLSQTAAHRSCSQIHVRSSHPTT
jgi:hypothetical protein